MVKKAGNHTSAHIASAAFVKKIRGGRLLKRGSDVFSVPPHMLEFFSSASRVAMGALIAMGAGLATAPAAQAIPYGRCVPDDTIVLCSGPASPDGDDATEYVNLTDREVVVTADGFGISATDDALVIFNYNDSEPSSITFLDEYASQISAGETGIYAVNGQGGGDITITTNGTVTALGDGVFVNQNGAAGNITLNVNNVSGVNAITAINDGSGRIDIVATGHLEATGSEYDYYSGYGIKAITDGGGDIDISVASVDAYNDGIYIENYDGVGRVDIDVTGDINSGSDGILVNRSHSVDAIDITVGGDIISHDEGVEVNSYGGDITINVAAITSSDGNGFEIAQRGNGNITITATGHIQSEDQGVEVDVYGVYSPSAYSTLTNVTVNVASITSSDEEAIDINHDSYGNINVTATGLLNAETERGVRINTGYYTGDVTVNVVDVTSEENAIDVEHEGQGEVNITATGTLTSTDDAGVVVDTYSSGVNVIIDVADIDANESAIVVNKYGSGLVNITATGTLNATSGGGVHVSTDGASNNVTIDVADINSYYEGVSVQQLGSGTIDITSSGHIQSAYSGVEIVSNLWYGQPHTSYEGDPYHANVIVNVNSIDSVYSDAIYIQHYSGGSVSVTATGDLEALAAGGVSIETAEHTNGVTVNVDNVTSQDDAIIVYHGGSGDVSVTATGTLTSTSLAGVFLTTGSDTDNVTIAVNAIDAAEMGISVDHQGEGTVGVTATGLIKAVDDGVKITVGNEGWNADDQPAILGDVTVSVADIETVADNAITINHFAQGSVNVTATGELSSAEQGGIAIETGVRTTDVIVDVADIASYSTGIKVAHNGTGNVTIDADNIDSGYLAIDVSNKGEGSINITSTGTVSGLVGIWARNEDSAQSLTIDVADVEGHYSGIYAVNNGTGTLSITSTGDIRGRGEDALPYNGVVATTGEDAGAMDISVHNVSSYADSLLLSAGGTGDVSITSTGLIENEYGTALQLYAHENVENVVVNVTDLESAGVAALVASYGSGSIDFTSTGAIESRYGRGVQVFASESVTDISVTVNDVDADREGVLIIATQGAGDITINTQGTVVAGRSAVVVDANEERDVIFTNEGALSSLGYNIPTSMSREGVSVAMDDTGSAHDVIGVFGGARLDLTNRGEIYGSITTEGGDDVLLNAGLWDVTGSISDFGAGTNSITNAAAGRIVAASVADIEEITYLNNVTSFNNAGEIDMIDGGMGDQLHVDGDIVLSAGSVLRVDIDADGLSDTLFATGNISIDGAHLQVNLTDGMPALGQKYQILSGETVTGSFATSEILFTPFFGLQRLDEGGNTYLEFVRLRVMTDLAFTPNQQAVAQALELSGGEGAVYGAVMGLDTDAQVTKAFDTLSGEIHPGVRTALAEDSRLPRHAVLDRLGQQDGTSAIWGQLFVSTGESDGGTGRTKLERDSKGFIMGADFAASEDVVFGVSAAYVSTDLDQRQRFADGSVDSAHLLAYVGAKAGAFHLKGGLGYAWGDVETKRNVNIGDLSDQLKAEYDANLFQAFAEVSTQVPLGGGFIEPVAQLAHVSVKTKGFTEIGGAAALTVASETETSTLSTLGLRFGTPKAGSLSVGGMIGWQHSFGSLTPASRMSLAESDSFRVVGAKQSRDAAVANVEARFQLSKKATLGIGYDGVLGTSSQDHAGKATFRLAF